MQWLRELLDTAKKTSKRTQADFARHLGVDPPRVTEMLKGDRRLQVAEIPKAAEFFGLPESHIIALIQGRAVPPKKANGKERQPAEGVTYPEVQVTHLQPRTERPDIPLWASAQAGDDGAMILVPDPIDYLRRSERMLSVRQPFAFNIIGTSMEPAIEHGDQVIINPSIVARPGHNCVFIHEGPEGMLALVKRLMRPGADHWKVRQFNPAKDFDISRKKWSRVHPIAEVRKVGVG